MREFLKKNYSFFIYLILLICLAYLFQSSSSKYEKLEQSSKLSIEKLTQESISLRSQLVISIESSQKLENSLKKANKQLKIVINKKADGSYTKEITSNSSTEQSNNSIAQENKTIKQEDLSINKEFMQKELTKAEESTKIIKEEKSRNNNVFLIIGGVAVCFLTGICAI